jgi:hypothetical protein
VSASNDLLERIAELAIVNGIADRYSEKQAQPHCHEEQRVRNHTSRREGKQSGAHAQGQDRHRGGAEEADGPPARARVAP